MTIRISFPYLLFTFFLSFSATSQNDLITERLKWSEAILQANISSSETITCLTFDNGNIKKENPSIATYSKRVPIPTQSEAYIEWIDKVYTPANELFTDLKMDISSLDQEVTYTTYDDAGQWHAGINFIPARLNNGRLELLTSFSYVVRTKDTPIARTEKKAPPTRTSVLADGQIYKLAIPQSGLYRLTASFLQDSLGINLSGLDPRNIRLYGHPGGPVPEAISADRVDDLRELPILISGESDGNMDAGDVLYFYGEGPEKYVFQGDEQTPGFLSNPYDDNNYYFLKIDSQDGLRISTRAAVSSPLYSTTGSEIQRSETNEINLLGQFSSTQGSGQKWFGINFSNDRTQRIGTDLDLEHLDTSSPVRIRAEFAGRSDEQGEVILSVDDREYRERFSRVNTGDIESLYARVVKFDESITLTSTNPFIQIDFPKDGNNFGWLDYLELQFTKELVKDAKPLIFKNIAHKSLARAGFQIRQASNTVQIWDVTNLFNTYEIGLDDSGQFGYDPQGSVREFVAFSESDQIPSPMAIGPVSNQNLHAHDDVDLAIIYSSEFEEATLQLAEHRSTFSNLKVQVVEVDHIYNEFSAGKQDPTAIRDYAKMLYDRSSRFKFLLIIGDGSYDYRHRVPGTSPQSFVPTYETKESLDPLRAFPTDDYFALLSDTEGGNLRGAIDIAVGRLPVKTLEEAQGVVNKIISYDTDRATYDPWRLRITFNADDEDSNIHIDQADRIAKQVSADYPVFNLDKIYYDAFQQVSTPGGARYPDANQKLNNDIFKGVLVMNYLGHGGPKGWSQERVLKISDITNWENKTKLPLIITATCSFTGFDDPELVTGGEHAILNEDGGAVALFSTVRSVFSSQNFRLTRSVFDTIFTRTDGDYLPIGEVMRRAKNSNSEDTTNINARKFLLIGDPTMKLAIPRWNITTDKINEKEVVSFRDTIRALDKVTIAGHVTDENGEVLTSFNGTIFPTVFDKEVDASTLANDRTSFKKKFEIQKNILFTGSASVTAGSFEFSFVVPKDINYQFGQGKISYYARNDQQEDAAGYYDQFIIGGTKEGGLDDDNGPDVQVFMNDDRFVSGGTTDAEPEIFVKLSDESGISFTGTSLGHDITAILDENTQNTIVLNEFYSASKDDFTQGTVRFPLTDLEEGLHTLRVKAFDVANNKGEDYTEFLVVNNEETALNHVLNYPNPFSTSTRFSFEHNVRNTLLNISIDVYTVSGKLVKTIRKDVIPSGYRIDDIAWNGKDDFDNQLANGVYLYKVKLRGSEGDLRKESDFEKLVILR